MRNLLLAFVLAALAIPASADIPMAASIHLNPSGGADVDLGFFFDSLSPYGNWVETPAYGWSFVPTVAPTWRPYTDGRWLHTDSGWTWLSDEPFGWATYHYGRWDLNPDYGWMWVPGDQWAPAWVDWRATDDFVGWAPLPPSFAVSPRLSFRTMDVALPAEAYVFVPETLFLQPQVVAYALPPGQAKKLFRSSRRFTRYRFANNLIINEGVPFVTIQQRVGRRIPRYQLFDLAPRFWGARPRARFAGNRVEIFRPRVLRTAVAVPPARPFARRSVMTISDAVRVRRVARARAVAFNLPPPPRSAFVSRRDFGRSRGIGKEVSRLRSRRDFGHSRGIGPPDRRPVVVGRDFGKTRGVGKEIRGQRAGDQRSRRDVGQGRGIGRDVRKQQVRPQRKVEVRREVRTQKEVRKSRGRSEVRRSTRGAPARQIKVERNSPRRSTKISPGGRSRVERQSMKQGRGGGGSRRSVTRGGGGGGGRKASVRNGGGGGGRRATVRRGGGGGGGRRATTRGGGGGRQGKRGGGRGH